MIPIPEAKCARVTDAAKALACGVGGAVAGIRRRVVLDGDVGKVEGVDDDRNRVLVRGLREPSACLRGGIRVNVAAWEAEVQREREEKNRFFLLDPRSPIPRDARRGLVRTGLSYFPLDPRLCFELPLAEHAAKTTIVVATSKTGSREFIRWGEFRFAVDGQPCVLQAYKRRWDEDCLWVPFRDHTSGQATYGAGRYLDLDPAHSRTAAGAWILDFNRSYNPWCAYSDAYSCPFIPPENWLAVPIRAGEKRFVGHGSA
jgi:uncharacterized protein (DUF1684 family)